MAPKSQTQEASRGDQAEATLLSLGPERSPKIQPWLKLKESKGASREVGQGQPAVLKSEHGFAAGEMFLIGHGGIPFKSCWTRVE
jgi:hypothetical protein